MFDLGNYIIPHKDQLEEQTDSENNEQRPDNGEMSKMSEKDLMNLITKLKQDRDEKNQAFNCEIEKARLEIERLNLKFQELIKVQQIQDEELGREINGHMNTLKLKR
jgi:transcription initiation factor IIF auxiliary subunit